MSHDVTRMLQSYHHKDKMDGLQSYNFVMGSLGEEKRLTMLQSIGHHNIVGRRKVDGDLAILPYRKIIDIS